MYVFYHLNIHGDNLGHTAKIHLDECKDKMRRVDNYLKGWGSQKRGVCLENSRKVVSIPCLLSIE